MLFANKYPSHLRQTRRSALVLLTLVSGMMLSRPALASEITVASPVSGTNVASPIWVRAHNVGCDNLTPTAFGYSIDNSSTFVPGVTPYDVDATHVAIGAGRHTIHFKSWTSNGICPVVNTTFTVGGSTTTNASSYSLSASYEIDLWGRNRAGVNAAKSSLQATAYDRDAARLTLQACKLVADHGDRFKSQLPMLEDKSA